MVVILNNKKEIIVTFIADFKKLEDNKATILD